MTINSEIQELKLNSTESIIDIKLLKKITKFLGPDNSPLRSQISLSNQDELNRIKNAFVIDLLGQTRSDANKIIKSIISKIKKSDLVSRGVFYYLILKEITSNDSKLPNIHPGEILLEEFLKPMNISAYRLSKDIGVPQTRISMILKGERGITADTALRLSKYLGTSSKFWLGLQNDYDLEESAKANLLELVQIKNCA